MSLSTALRSSTPVTFVGRSTPRSSRREAVDRMTSWVSVSLDIGIVHCVGAASLPPPPQPHLGHAAGGAGSRDAPRVRNGHSTALLADECQSFLDNVIAGLGQIEACNDRCRPLRRRRALVAGPSGGHRSGARKYETFASRHRCSSP